MKISRTFHIMAGCALALSSVTTEVQAQEAITDLSVLEGEWKGFQQAPFGPAHKVLFAATPVGAQVSIKGTMQNCTLVVDPETFQAYPSGSSRGDCNPGKLTASLNEGNLTLNVEGWKNAAEVQQISAPPSVAWVTQVPTNSTNIRGVWLAAPDYWEFAETEGYGITEGAPDIGTKLQIMGRLPDMYRRGSFMGMAGTPFLDAQHYLGSSPEDVPGLDSEFSYDNVGVYVVDSFVAAVVRVYQPSLDQAPQFDAFHDAVLAQLGTPTVGKMAGTNRSYEWHYDTSGNLYPQGQGPGLKCQFRFDGSDADTRLIGMQYNTTEVSLLEIRQGKPARVEQRTKQVELRATPGCGASISYNLRAASNGLLKSVEAVMFAHAPVASSIWTERKDKIASQISRELELQKKSADVEIKL